MISKTVRAAAFGLLCSLPLAAPASAQGMGGHMGHMGAMSGMSGMHGGSSFMMLLKSADLTPAQQQQVQLILNSSHTQMTALHGQLMALHEQISAKLLGPGTVTSADLKPLVQQASTIEGNLNQSMADTAIAIRNVLTPEQLTKLAQVHKKLHDLHTQVQKLMGSDKNAPDTDN